MMSKAVGGLLLLLVAIIAQRWRPGWAVAARSLLPSSAASGEHKDGALAAASCHLKRRQPNFCKAHRSSEAGEARFLKAERQAIFGT